MKYFSILCAPLLLSVLLFSCQDHVGIPTEDGQHVRLKRLYNSSVSVPGRSYNDYTDFFYDESGRLNSVPHFTIDKNGTPVLDQHTIIFYDAQGKVERERTDGMEARSIQYDYDSQNRLENVWITTDGVSGVNGFHLKYDQSNQVNERLFYVLNAEGDSTTLSHERYIYDGNKNIIGIVQNYSSDINPPFVRHTTYRYDDKPNPWKNLPVFIYKSAAYLNSQNNALESSFKETYFPPNTTTYSDTHQFNNKYNNGILEEIENGEQNAWKFVYESY